VEVNVHNEARLVYSPDVKLKKQKIPMEDAKFSDGSKQALYFKPGHPQAGLFKGMTILLAERGMVEESKSLTQCKNFKCTDKKANCCQRRTLYNQPDFVCVKSLLETMCEAQGFRVLLIPKFHCELNFIEQCWGYAKRIYRHYPASSKEANLECNVLAALESVPLESMRK
jgi:hypothetical protein